MISKTSLGFPLPSPFPKLSRALCSPLSLSLPFDEISVDSGALKGEEIREMGKYIQKGKITGEVAVMEVSHHHQPSLGVRTRARTKTLALNRLQKSKPRPRPLPCSSSASSSSSKSSSCYLQLRSRRLEKCFPPRTQRAANPRTNASPVSSPQGSKRCEGSKDEGKSENDAGIEVSFGENVLEGEGEGKSSRNSRETTPCSLIRRDSETIGTPGSTTRPTSTTASTRRVQSPTRRNFPNSHEMEEFFAVPEQQQQRAFAEKYNFDPAKDSPLAGRYEWVKVDN